MALNKENKINNDNKVEFLLSKGNTENWIININQVESTILIGIHDHESKPQRIIVNCHIEGKAAAAPVNISECIDYDKIYNLIVFDWPKREQVLLLETLVVELLSFIFLEEPRVSFVHVDISKPDVFSKARSVGVGMEWSRTDYEIFNQMQLGIQAKKSNGSYPDGAAKKIRSVVLTDVPLQVVINHEHLPPAARVDKVPSRSENLIIAISVDFEWGRIHGKTIDGIFNYAAVYYYIKAMTGRIIDGPLEVILDDIFDFCEKSAKDQNVAMVDLMIELRRPELMSSCVKLVLKHNYRGR